VRSGSRTPFAQLELSARTDGHALVTPGGAGRIPSPAGPPAIICEGVGVKCEPPTCARQLPVRFGFKYLGCGKIWALGILEGCEPLKPPA
jgi:hypothetical protein